MINDTYYKMSKLQLQLQFTVAVRDKCSDTWASVWDAPTIESTENLSQKGEHSYLLYFNFNFQVPYKNSETVTEVRGTHLWLAPV